MNYAIKLRDLPRFKRGLPVQGYSATPSWCRTNEYARFVGTSLRYILARWPQLRRAVAGVAQNIGEELGKGPEKIIQLSKAERSSIQMDTLECGGRLVEKTPTNIVRLWPKS